MAVLVEVALGDGAGFDQVRVARAIGLCAVALRSGRADHALRGAHVRCGELFFGIERNQRGLGDFDRGVRVLQIGRSGGDARVEFFGIDTHQRIALPDALVVLHEHVGDEAAHLRRDDRAVGLQISRVRRDRASRHQDIERAEHAEQHGCTDGGDGAAPERLGCRGRRKRTVHCTVAHRSNTSKVDVADAYNWPSLPFNVASANATRRPKLRIRPSARNGPVAVVIALWNATFNSSVV